MFARLHDNQFGTSKSTFTCWTANALFLQALCEKVALVPSSFINVVHCFLSLFLSLIPHQASSFNDKSSPAQCIKIAFSTGTRHYRKRYDQHNERLLGTAY
jgi:hypothetical protein